MILFSLRHCRELEAILSEDEEGPYLLVDQQRVVRPTEDIALAQFRILECEEWEKQVLEEAGFKLKTVEEALDEWRDARSLGGWVQEYPTTPPMDDDDSFL